MAIRAYTWVVTNEHTTQAEPYESMTIRDDSAWATNEAIEEIARRLLPCPFWVNDMQTARAFIAHVVVYRGLGLNLFPMQDFIDYKMFSEWDVKQFNRLRDECLKSIGVTEYVLLVDQLCFELHLLL